MWCILGKEAQQVAVYFRYIYFQTFVTFSAFSCASWPSVSRLIFLGKNVKYTHWIIVHAFTRGLDSDCALLYQSCFRGLKVRQFNQLLAAQLSEVSLREHSRIGRWHLVKTLFSKYMTSGGAATVTKDVLHPLKPFLTLKIYTY